MRDESLDGPFDRHPIMMAIVTALLLSVAIVTVLFVFM
jgi:hypothetical protein